MNNAHLHLLLNHVPTVGTVIAFGLLLMSFLRKNDGMKRIALELFFVIAIVTLPAYLSGVGTQVMLQETGPRSYWSSWSGITTPRCWARSA